jgi:hypothetical protein
VDGSSPERGLVEEEQARPGEQFDRDAGPLALPARQVAHPHVGTVGEVEVVQGLVDGSRDPGRVGARRQPQPGRVAQRTPQRQVPVDDVVLRDEAGSGRGAVRHGGAVVQHGTGRRRLQPGHGLEQGGFAGAAAADEGDHLAGRHRE